VYLKIDRATFEDRGNLTALLETCGLSGQGILAPGTMYWVCRAGSALVGACGIEVGQGCALLRSVCVCDTQRGHHIAKRLIDSALSEADRLGLWDVFLFSKDTGTYFERLGWRSVAVDEVVARLA
jgi:N-acetylglutamate synthase-like GNAT family acetyltransferase